MALRIFMKYPAIKAAYLTPGGAKEKILTLGSDLDFAVIVDMMKEEDKKVLCRAYKKLARVTTILDHFL